MIDVLVIGTGPAGMSAAIDLLSMGFAVTIADDQPTPGGRIFAAIENRDTHGAEERSGAELARRFREAGGQYLPGTEAWQLEPGPRVFLTRHGRAVMIEPSYVVLATGAQERPMPFPGWQLPGVMTVGAAQILMKTARQVPDRPVWLAGSGPLLLLYVHQLIAAGGQVAGILDTARPGRAFAAARFIPRALGHGWRDMLRGIGWLARTRGLTIIRGVESIEADGADKLSIIRYGTRDGTTGEIEAGLLLVHDGVVPGVHATLAAGCKHQWNATQRCFEPIVDDFGTSSDPSIFVAGDGATIGGAQAAMVSGRLAAVGVAKAAGRLSEHEASARAVPLHHKLSSVRRFRRFVDALYPPTELSIPDTTMVCRCEEVTAGQVRSVLANRPHLGPDGVKIETRAGMGPCQGRQCGLSLTRLVAEAHGQSRAEVGYLRIRPPLKPLTLRELASLETVA